MLDWTIWAAQPGGRGTVTYLAACRESNAALIAAAPDLLDALRDTTRALGDLTAWLRNRQWLPPGDPMLMHAHDIAAHARVLCAVHARQAKINPQEGTPDA